MTQELEWGGLQQLALLLRSGLVGIGIGVFYDIVAGLWCGCGKARRFWADVLFCALASLITFFSSLILTNGRLHPVLFFGIAIGLLLEHMTVGKWVSRWAHKIVCMFRAGVSVVASFLRWFFGKIGFFFSKLVALLFKKERNVKKT